MEIMIYILFILFESMLPISISSERGYINDNKKMKNAALENGVYTFIHTNQKQDK